MALALITITPACNCPSCGRAFNAASHSKSLLISPKHGDLSVCCSCGAFLSFESDLTVRQLHALEVGTLPTEVIFDLYEQRDRVTGTQRRGQ